MNSTVDFTSAESFPQGCLLLYVPFLIGAGFNSLPLNHIVAPLSEYNKKNYKGLAWSRELRVAEWFARRFGEHGTVYRATIDKRHVLAYFARRNEAEVVVDPHYLKDVQKYREVSSRN